MLEFARPDEFPDVILLQANALGELLWGFDPLAVCDKLGGIHARPTFLSACLLPQNRKVVLHHCLLALCARLECELRFQFQACGEWERRHDDAFPKP
jgi:hypothetical protein